MNILWRGDGHLVCNTNRSQRAPVRLLPNHCGLISRMRHLQLLILVYALHLSALFLPLQLAVLDFVALDEVLAPRWTPQRRCRIRRRCGGFRDAFEAARRMLNWRGLRGNLLHSQCSAETLFDLFMASRLLAAPPDEYACKDTSDLVVIVSRLR